MGTVETLKKFCAASDGLLPLSNPWTRGEFSYATDGHIWVRVPALAEVPENPRCPNMAKVTAFIPEDGPWISAPSFEWPEISSVDCDYCEKDEPPHDCPHCECECDVCDGKGVVESKVSASLGGMAFDVKYLRLIWSLPGLQLGPSPAKDSDPLAFCFDGGVGGLMGIRWRFDTHIQTDIDLPVASFA